MQFTEQQALAFKKLLKVTKLTQKALVSQLNKQGYQLDVTVLSNALNQRRKLPSSYTHVIKEKLEEVIDTQSMSNHPQVTSLLHQVFSPYVTNNASTIAKPTAYIQAGKPLPAHTNQYISRPFDTEIDNYIEQNRPTILITYAPKYGATSLFNRIEPLLNAKGKTVLRISMWQSFIEAKKRGLIEEVSDIALISVVLLYAIDNLLKSKTKVEVDYAQFKGLPNHFFLVQKKAKEQLDDLLPNRSEYCMIIDDLDKMLYQKIISLNTQTDFLFLLKDVVTQCNRQVICGVSPFVWFQDQYTSNILRQVAIQEVNQLDHYRTKQLHGALLNSSDLDITEFSLGNTSKIQEVTESLGGNPFLLHWLLEQKQCVSLHEAFNLLIANFDDIEELTIYKQQLAEIAELLKDGYIPNFQNIDIHECSLENYDLLIRFNLSNIQSYQLNKLYDFSV